MSKVSWRGRLLAASISIGAASATHAQPVSNREPTLPLNRAWRVGAEPVFVAGDGAAGDTLQFHRVRGVVRLAQGRIAVANAGGHELVFLNPDGSLFKRTGRQGPGPGEFEDVSSIGTTADGRLWAMDLHRGRLSVFDDTGGFVRSFPLRQLVPATGMTPRGALADGRLVLTSGAIMLGGPAGAFDSTNIVVFDPRTESHRAVARIPKPDLGDPVGSKIFGPHTVTAARGDAIYWASGSQFEVFVLGADGALRSRITKPTDPRPLTGNLWRSYVDRRVSAIPGSTPDREAQRRRVRHQLEQTERPRSLPVLDRLLLDEEGNVWVREYEIAGVLPGVWHVFASNGRWLTTVDPPGNFRLHEASSADLLGVLLDESGVERVALLPLVKP